MVARFTQYLLPHVSFLEGIANYQSHNPQFDFLKPTHILNSYFSSLVEQYSKIIHFDKEIKDPLLEKYKHREESLRVAVHRMEYHRQQEEAKKEKENDDLASLQTVDWNDFVVVETITFDEDMGVGAGRGGDA